MKGAPSAVAALAAALLCSLPAAGATIAEGDVVATGPPIPVVDAKGEPADLRAVLALPAPSEGTPPGATLLVFWGTWCQPCLHEVPEIREIGRFYGKQGLRVVSVATTWNDDTLERVMETARSNGIDYEILFDGQDSARRAFGVTSLPTTLLIDGRGVVRWRGNLLPGDINARIKTALGAGGQRGAKQP